MDPAWILLQTPIFRDLGQRDVEELQPDLRHRSFARGETVWLEGDPAEALCIVADGQLKSYRVGRDGREVIIRIHYGVDVTGEVGLFHPSGVRQVNLSAMTAASCLMLARAPLLEFLARHPDALRRLLEQMSTVTAQAAYSISGIAFDDIRRRVAGTLVALADEFGDQTTDRGVRIRLRLSQGTLAALVAASRENVNRALSTFVAGGAVSQHNGYFFLHDRIALEQAAAAEETW